jgi:predicted alpha/beta hydrolase family esterase
VNYAGIPYQDPTPKMQKNYNYHANISSVIFEIGLYIFITSLVIYMISKLTSYVKALGLQRHTTDTIHSEQSSCAPGFSATSINIKIILIHGNDTLRWSYAWMPWAKSELEKLGFEVVGETFPDSIIAREKYWTEFLMNRINANENTILVGHSSGALCAMRFAETHKILGSVLIGAMHTDLGDELEKQSGYFDRPWEWEKIKEHQSWIIQFASTDDPYIPIEEARHVREMLKTEYHEFSDRGHFFNNQEKFPELIMAIKEKITNHSSYIT